MRGSPNALLLTFASPLSRTLSPLPSPLTSLPSHLSLSLSPRSLPSPSLSPLRVGPCLWTPRPPPYTGACTRYPPQCSTHSTHMTHTTTTTAATPHAPTSSVSVPGPFPPPTMHTRRSIRPFPSCPSHGPMTPSYRTINASTAKTPFSRVPHPLFFHTPRMHTTDSPSGPRRGGAGGRQQAVRIRPLPPAAARRRGRVHAGAFDDALSLPLLSRPLGIRT